MIVYVLSDLTSLPLLGGGRKSRYIIIIVTLIVKIVGLTVKEINETLFPNRHFSVK